MITVIAIVPLLFSWWAINSGIDHRLISGRDHHLFMVAVFWASAVVTFFPFWFRSVVRESRLAPVLGIVGMASNAVVTLANGGYMPVMDGYDGAWWVRMDHTSRLIPLADIIHGASIGDLFLAAGIVMYMIEGILRTGTASVSASVSKIETTKIETTENSGENSY